jgi:hypothetical protein
MVAASDIVAGLNANGFAIVEGVLSEDETLRLLAAIEWLADIGSWGVLRFRTSQSS